MLALMLSRPLQTTAGRVYTKESALFSFLGDVHQYALTFAIRSEDSNLIVSNIGADLSEVKGANLRWFALSCIKIGNSVLALHTQSAKAL